MVLLAEATSDGSEFIDPAALAAIYGGAIGVWLGQALGGSWGSATETHRVPARALLLSSALWTSAGLLAFGSVGLSFEEEDTPETDASWYVGAAVGALVNVVGMSVTTHRKAGSGSRSAALPLVQFYPSSDGRWMLSLRIEPGA